MKQILSILVCGLFFAVFAGENLLRHWKLDEGKGYNATDSSPMMTHAAVITDPAWENDPERGTVLVFNGKSTLVEMPLPGTIHEIKAWSIDFYCRPDRCAGMEYMFSMPGFFVRLVNGLLNAGVQNGAWQENKSVKLTPGKWYRITVTVDGKSAECYLDGKPTGSMDSSGLVFDNRFKALLGLTCYARNRKTSKDYFQGALSDIKIFDRKLTPEEITGISPEEKELRRLGKIFRDYEKEVMFTQLVKTGKFTADGYMQELSRAVNAGDREKLQTLLQKLPKKNCTPGKGLNIWQLEATDERRIMPDTIPSVWGIAPAREVLMAATGGEYEAVSLALNSTEAIKDLNVTVELPGFNAADIDLKYVLRNKQYGGAWSCAENIPGRSVAVPEILVNDPMFLSRRFDLQQEVLDDGRILIPVKDAKTFRELPLLARNHTIQLMLTLHIPENQAAKLYHGKISFASSGKIVRTLPLSVRVFPGALPRPATKYDPARKFETSVYYWGEPSDKSKLPIGKQALTDTQMRAQMVNMAKHNISSPIFVLDYKILYNRHDLVKKMFGMAQAAGMCQDDIYFGMSGETDAETPEALEALGKRVSETVKFLKSIGIKGDIYWYGSDEAKGDKPRRQLPAMRKIQESGGKVLVSCLPGVFSVYGGTLNLANHFGLADREEADKWHSVNARIWNYGAPFAGMENADIYRRNYGLALWLLNYDGVANYCYTCPFKKNAWMRGDKFVYATVDSVVDTLSWESFREGIDDIRYAVKLDALIRKVPDGTAGKAEAVKFLDSLRPREGDLTLIRLKMIHHINNLSL